MKKIDYNNVKKHNNNGENNKIINKMEISLDNNNKMDLDCSPIKFIEYCKNGLLDKVIKSFPSDPNRFKKNIAKGFRESYTSKHYDTMKWIMDSYKKNNLDNLVDFEYYFQDSCENGDKDFATILYHNYRFNICNTKKKYDKKMTEKGKILIKEISEKYNLEIIVKKLNVPKTIIRYIIMNFLSLKDIKKIIFITKVFNVLNSENKLFLYNANKGFKHCCINGHLNISKWLFHNKKIRIMDTGNHIFLLSCIHGQLNVIKWLHSLSPNFLKIGTIKNSFKECCSYGKFEIAKWLFETYNIDKSKSPHEIINESFMTSCMYGHMDISKWLSKYIDLSKEEDDHIFTVICAFDKGHIEMAKWLYDLLKKLVKNFDPTDQFNECIYDNNLECAEWLYKLGDVDIYNNNESSFSYNCKYGNLDKAKFLYKLGEGKINIHANDNDIFRSCCREGHLEISEWLLELGGELIDIHKHKHELFYFSCIEGNLKMAKWLYSFGEIDIHHKNEKIFRYVCVNGKIKTAKWLYELENIDIHAKNDFAFRWACRMGRLDTAKWLYKLGNVDVHCKKEYVFRLSCVMGKINIAKWLYHDVGNIDVKIKNEWAYHFSDYDTRKWLKTLYPQNN